MHQNNSTTLKMTDWKNPLLFGLLGGAVSILFILIFAFLLSSKTLPQSSMPYLAPLSLFCGALTGSTVSSKKAKEKKIVHGLLSGGTIFLLIITLSIFHKDTNIFCTQMIINLGTVAVGSLLGTLLSLKKGRRRKRRPAR